MLHQDTLPFLQELSLNNNKEWFEQNKPRYESIKLSLRDLVKNWIIDFGKFDTQIAHLEPSKCLFRQNRDVRFSANKAPYKTNLAAYLSEGGKGWFGAGYYLHIAPNASFFATGVWMPEPKVLKTIRQEIDYNFTVFEKIINEPSLQNAFGNIAGEKLQRPPKGYEADNKAIEYLKHKSFIFSTPLSDTFFDNPKATNEIVGLSKIAQPFVKFINQCLTNS